MIVRAVSQLTGDVHERDIPGLTPDALANWRDTGAFVQDAFPFLSADDREFLLTGITPEEWNAAFPPELEEA